MRCNALLLVCCGSDRGGAGRGRQGREGRVSGGRESGLEKFYCVFFLFFLFLINIVLTWKIVGASKASVIYIYIYIDKIGNTFSLFVTRKIVPNLINPLVQIP